ncbi:MSMEG_1061 family FMN-dependent PPOX-type flavoprotein [Paenibacillus chitinolyticus]|uniref:MSMEG_1061 family FMN-dependent PPOX-type flavoprotein n=1 Tax=Paenibacillus chitinolyticus TaxID=79263 RepID=UPI00365E52CF
MDYFEDRIEAEAELREMLGYPNKIVEAMKISYMERHCREFIGLSPILFASTADLQGNCDVSPRGDAPGFVKVLDDHHLIIPERPGNRRMNTYRNILENPHIGLIFIIPGLEETLRINGKACLTKNPKLLAPLEAHGKIPKLAIGVEVEEVFLHCAKAFKRSDLWDTKTWPRALPSVPEMIAAHAGRPDITADVVSKGLKESYEKRMY